MANSQPSTQVLSFDSFAALESHLKATRERYEQAVRRYEEVLGDVLRQAKPTDAKAKNQEQWAQNMKQSLSSKDAKGKGKPLKLNKNSKQGAPSEEWISLDPVSVFVGRTNRGVAELYFEAINHLKDDLVKINSAFSMANRLKAKSSSTGNAALLVSMIDDIPSRIVVKSGGDEKKKYSIVCQASVPVAASHLGFIEK